MAQYKYHNIDKAKVGQTGRWFGYSTISLERAHHVVGTIIKIQEGRDYRTVKIATELDGRKTVVRLYF